MFQLKIVEADIYNLDFHHLKTINHNNVQFIAIEDYNNIREEVKKCRESRENILTGTVKVEIPDHIEEEMATDYSIELLYYYDLLLGFAQNRDLFFNNYSLFNIENGERKHKSTLTKSIRIGKKYPVPIIYHKGLKNFLEISIPLIMNNDYDKKTGIRRILAFWKECNLYTTSVVEINIPLLFSALEVVSNLFLENNPTTFLFPEERWKEIITDAGKFCDSLNIVGHERDRILGSLGFLKSGSAKEKIQYMLERLGFPIYNNDLSNIIKLRNDIIHGRKPKDRYESDDPADLALKCLRLVEKIILHFLNFLDKPQFLHGAYTKEDLRAIM